MIKDEENQWFESDGRLIILPDPRLETSFKPFSSSELTEKRNKSFDTDYVPPKVYSNITSLDDFSSSEIFEIEIHSLKFSHHPLFSPEHVFSSKLISLFDQFIETKRNNKFITLQKTLEALIFTRKRLRNQPESGDVVDTKKIEHYDTEIRDVRTKMYNEGFRYRELIKSILFTWKSIKAIRNEQKYTNTSVKLIIKKEYNDYDFEKENWEQNIEEEANDIASDYEKTFSDCVKKYKTDLKEWKEQKKAASEDDDDEIVPDRPKKPQKVIDRDKIVDEVTEKCLKSLKPPGEPILDFELSKDDEQVTKDVVNPKELLRRSALNKTQIIIKITYNKQEICKSKMVSLTNEFVVDFYEPFTIKIASTPLQFTLDIYEQNGAFGKKLLHQINLLDTLRKPSEDVIVECFKRSEKQSCSHTGVGSGVSIKNVFKSYDLVISSDEELFTSGTLTWKGVVEEKTVTLTSTVQNIKMVSSASKILNVDNIFELSKTYIDPLDPQNSLIYEYVNEIERSPKKDYFRLEPEMRALEFCTSEEIDNNPRFKMLRLRDRNEPEFQGAVVPNRVKEISEDAFVAYEKRCEENQSSVMIEEFRKDDIEGQRKWGLKHLQRAENKVIQLCKVAENKMTLQDVLTEETIPTLGYVSNSEINYKCTTLYFLVLLVLPL